MALRFKQMKQQSKKKEQEIVSLKLQVRDPFDHLRFTLKPHTHTVYYNHYLTLTHIDQTRTAATAQTLSRQIHKRCEANARK